MKHTKIIFLVCILIVGAVVTHFEMDPDYFMGDSRLTEENVDNLEDSISDLHFELYHTEQTYMHANVRDSIFTELMTVDSTVDAVGKVRYDNDLPLIGYSHYLREGESFKKKLTDEQCDSLLRHDFDHALATVISKKMMPYDSAYIAASYLLSNPQISWKKSPHSEVMEFDDEFIEWLDKTKKEMMGQKK